MALSAITLAAVIPLLATSTIQLQESAQNQQSKKGELDTELKTQKCHLRVRASDRMSEGRKEIVKDRIVVLRNQKVGSAYSPSHRVLAERNTDDVCRSM